MDNLWGLLIVIFLGKLISRSVNITPLDGNTDLDVTEGENTIGHSKIVYAVLTTVLYVCVY